MGNTLITMQEIARHALPQLMDNLVFPGLIHRDYSEDFHGRGDTVKVIKPAVFTAADFDDANGVNYQDITESSIDVKLDHIASVDARATAIESATSIDDLNRVFIQPAAAALAEKINREGLELYKDVNNYVGTAGTTPSTLAAVSAARKALNKLKVPVTDRCAVWDVEADAALSSVDAIVHAEKSGSTKALREGAIGRVFGMENYMSQAVCAHTTGITAATAVKVASNVSAGATKISLSATSLTGKLVKGDIMTISGKNYVVTEETSAASSNAISNIKVYPALPAINANTEVTLVASHTANLVFHPKAFAYVTRPLTNPDGQGVESYVTSYNGLSLRVTRGYDQTHKRSIYSMDVLYGFKTVYPELAVRVLG